MRRALPVLALAAVLAIAVLAAFLTLSSSPSATDAQPPDRSARRSRSALRDRDRVRAEPRVEQPDTSPILPDELDWRGDERLEGWIVDVDEVTPGVGVTIQIIPAADRHKERPRVWKSVVTDARGRYVIDGVAKREHVLRIVAEHRVPRTFTRRPGHSVGRRRRPMIMGRDPRTHFVVTDEHDAPVPGATLYVLNLRGEPVETFAADSRGRIWWNPRDQVRLVFAAQGHSSERVTFWRSKKDTMVRMQRGHILAGTVRDTGGQPLPGVAVELGTIDIPKLQPLREVAVEVDTTGFPEMDVLTDALGRFRFEGLSESPTRRVIATKEGYRKTVVLASTGRDDIEIGLEPEIQPGSMSGVVLRPDGTPAVGALVDLTTETDAKGRFAIDPCMPGERRVGATWGEIDAPEIPGRLFRERGSSPVNVPPGGNDSGVVIRLETIPISFLSVRVTAPDERPLAGAIVRTTEGHAALTDERGVAHLRFPLPPNSTAQVAVGAGDAVDVVTRAALDGTIHRIDGESAPRLRIVLQGVAEDAATWVRVTALRNGFPVDSVETSEHVHEITPDVGERLIVDVYVNDELVAARLLEPVGPGGRREIIDVSRGATAKVRVELPEGKPPPRLRSFLVVPVVDRCWRRVITHLEYDGPRAWTTSNAASGPMQLLVTWNGLALVRNVTISPTGRNELVVRLPRPIAVTGTVRDSNGKGLGGCHVGVRLGGGAIGPTPLGHLATSATDGTWSAPLAALPDCRLAISRKGHATALLAMTNSLAGSARVVTLQKEGVLRIIAPSGASYAAYARLPGSGFAWQLDDFDVEQAWAPDTGLVMRVHHLPIGDVEIALANDKFEVTHHRVRIDPGRETTLDLSRGE